MHNARGITVSADRSSFADLRIPRRLRPELVRLQSHSPDIFASLFTHDCGASADEVAAFPALITSGIVRYDEGRFRSLFRAFYHDGLFVVSDWKGSAPDEVFRPWQAEVDVTAPFFLSSCAGAGMLDLGCGSGLYSIAAAAAGASNVLAVDVNPRALAAARFGARLNGVADRVDVRRSNLFDDVAGRFDVILVGLPYRPTPSGPGGKVYANGGAAGVAHIERVFRRASAHLHPGGQIRVCCMSLGDGRHTLIERRAVAVFGHDPAWELRADTVGGAARFRDWWYDNGDPMLAAEGWLTQLESEGLTHFQRVRIAARYVKAL